MATTTAATNPVDQYRQEISDTLASVTGLMAEKVYPKLQYTQTQEKGDLILPVAALTPKGGKAAELAVQWAEKFPESEKVGKPVVASQYLQFYFKPVPLAQTIISIILNAKGLYGTNHKLGLKDSSDASQGRKRVIVEFSSPNIAKPFHAGHLRSTIIGGFLANLYEAAGWDVVRMNYLGDWGRQFGLLAIAFDSYGSEEKLAKDPIGHLYDIYVQINRDSGPEEEVIKEKKEQLKELYAKGTNTTELESEIATLERDSVNGKARAYFKKLEEAKKVQDRVKLQNAQSLEAVQKDMNGEESEELGDSDTAEIATWRRFRNLSIIKYKQTYARLNIRYDFYSGESMVESERLELASEELQESGVSEKSDGAVIVDFTKDPKTKKLGKAIIKKKDGSTLYLTRDIAEAVKRHKVYDFDQMIYVVMSQQDLHLAQLFKILERMGHGDVSTRCRHINFGMVLGMSTRKGTVKFLDDILRDVGDKMHEVMLKDKAKYANVTDPKMTADILGITAVMVQDMTGKRINNYEFKLDRMTATEGDTGPYLQYAHVRLCSIARAADLSDTDLKSADFSLLQEPQAINLIRSLASWPDTVQRTLETLEPTTVLTYLFRMSHLVSTSYDVLRVVGSEPELKKARMALYEAARQVLNNGMKMLGLTPLERM